GARAHLEPVGAPQLAQAGHAPQSNQRRRGLLTTFHVREEVGAPGDEHRVLGIGGQKIGHFADRARGVIPKIRKPEHGSQRRVSTPVSWWPCRRPLPTVAQRPTDPAKGYRESVSGRSVASGPLPLPEVPSGSSPG